MAENVFDDDRRRIVNAGTLRGRDEVIADASRIAGVGAQTIAAEVIATRGERLVLSRVRYSGGHGQQETFHVDALDVVEIDADECLVAHVSFDPDDLDAAFEELDARYLGGEAAAYADMWSVTTAACAALNRYELPTTTADFVDLDHRRAVSIEDGGMKALLRTALDHTPVMKHHIEAVHRLTECGSVITQVAHGTSDDGFDAEWRVVGVLTMEDDLINRCEVFDEDDLDDALARFDELTQQAPQLENAASRTCAQFYTYLGARDWDAVADMLADDVCNDDRRRVVSSDIQRGRAAQIANLRAVVDVGVTNFSTAATATRGNRLALQRTRVSGADLPDPFSLEMLCVVEIDADNRIAAAVLFDPDDIDSAFEELDARYLAGEAAQYAQAWSVIANGYAALNRRGLPAATPDAIDIDHRQLLAIEEGDLGTSLQALWGITSQSAIYVEAVHQLSDVGAVVSHVASATSPDGVDAEWRDICILTIDGDRFNRAEVFDEADLDAALARFDELGQQPPS